MTFFLLLACARPPVSLSRGAEPALIAQRPGEALPTLGPDARVDLGLRGAAEELASVATNIDARLTPGAVRLALARAGYPGDAQFFRFVGGTTISPDVLAEIPHGEPVDVGWAFRDFGDGRRWWVLGWARRRGTIDPVPRGVRLGSGTGVRVDGLDSPTLFVGTPDGGVTEMSATAGTTRWLGSLYAPGEYRVEIVEADRVAYLFSLFVGVTPSPMAPLPTPVPVENPLTAADALYADVARLRASLHLPVLTRFEAYEAPSREHAACIALTGILSHATASCPGVPDVAGRDFFPRAKHHEDLAVAPTAAEAWDVILASPGHRRNLLCTDCTHIAVGAALEPAVSPRLFFAIETLEFPDGTPQPIRKWR